MKPVLFFLALFLAHAVHADSAKAHAPVVLVARQVSEGEGGLYRWDTIEVLAVRKSPSGFKWTRRMRIAVRYDMDPIGARPTEIRLERYNSARNDLWQLVESRPLPPPTTFQGRTSRHGSWKGAPPVRSEVFWDRH